MKEIEQLKEFLKQNIPSAEILNVSHTEKIFGQSENDKEEYCQPSKIGFLVLIDNTHNK